MTRTMKLDCPHVDVRMFVDTEIEERYRIKACSKEPWTCDWIHQMPQGSVLYDVGACVGSYTLLAAALGHTVVAIEPSFANYARLCENVLLNDLGHKIIPMCVGLGKGHTVEVMQQEPQPGYSGGAKRLMVPMLPLSSLPLCVPRPTHIKLDTDGNELDVIKGACGMEGISWLVEVQTGQERQIEALLGVPKVIYDTRGGHKIQGMSMRLYERA